MAVVPIVSHPTNERVDRSRRPPTEQQFALMAEAAPIGLAMADTTGEAWYVNGKLAELLGRPANELLGSGWLGAVGLIDEVARVDWAGEVPVTIVRERRPVDRPDGTTAWLDIGLHPAVDGAGQVWGRIGIVTDVTAKVRSEDRQRQRDARLRVAERLKGLGRLAGRVAHDFNNVLMAVVGYAELAEAASRRATHAGAGDGDSAALLRNLDQLQQAAGRGASLTARLLAFGRPDIAHPRSVDLAAVIADVEAQLGSDADGSIEVVNDRGPDLWPVWADSRQLRQVLLNLASNARDAMPGGGQLRFLTVNYEATSDENGAPAPGRYVRLSVTDTGHGMAPTVLEHALDPFFTTKPVGQGTGLGLATAHSVVCQYGGGFVIRSEVGTGTTVDVYLPAAEETREPGVEVAEERFGGTETVLVVDDELSIGDIATQMLTGAGYEVLTALGGEEALALAQRCGPIDLLLTDLVMPNMYGDELARRLIHLDPRTRVLYMSGFADTLRHAGRIAGDIAMLAKPFSSHALLRSVRSVLDVDPAEEPIDEP